MDCYMFEGLFEGYNGFYDIISGVEAKLSSIGKLVYFKGKNNKYLAGILDNEVGTSLSIIDNDNKTKDLVGFGDTELEAIENLCKLAISELIEKENFLYKESNREFEVFKVTYDDNIGLMKVKQN